MAVAAVLHRSAIAQAGLMVFSALDGAIWQYFCIFGSCFAKPARARMVSLVLNRAQHLWVQVSHLMKPPAPPPPPGNWKHFAFA